MALRLTGSTLAAPDSGAGTTGGLPAAGPALRAHLQAQAPALIGARRLDDYRDLFTRVGEIEDPQVRYTGRVILLEQGLTAANRASSSSEALALFLAVAETGLEALEQEPREPLILNYVAIAMYELWSIDAARALFQAAHRLDSELPHARRNLAECKRRARELSRGRVRRPMHAALPSLGARAKRVAAQAQPAKGLKLSLCMIVRDEEEMLPQCLAAAAPAVDEIVIVDTGSTDRTIEIARSFGARVIEREWTGSFSDARNVSFEAATGDWIIYLDADEVLVAEDVERLRALTGRVWREAFYLVETSFTGHSGDGMAVTHNAMRVFRNRPSYRFEGRLHEQISHQLPMYAPGRVERTQVRVEHYGYLGVVREAKEKSSRNIELLRAQAAESPADAFLHFNLGTEYVAAGDPAAALTELEQAWKLIKDGGEEFRDYVPSLLQRLAGAMRTCGRAEEAIALAERGLKLFPGFTDLVFSQGLAALALGREDEAIAAFNRCIEMGDGPALYGSAVGWGTYMPRVALAELFAKRGEVDQVRALLEWCIDEHPGFIGVVQPYAAVLLRGGMAADEVVAEIERRLPQANASVRFLLAGALFGAGAMEAAEAQCRKVLDSRPHNAQARAQLAETLLHRRRYVEAAAEAARLAEDETYAALACRMELWGRIAGGDLDGARAAHGRAAAAGVSAAEREVFAAWLELAEGKPEPRRLPVAAVPLLAVVMETLLRSQDFETFEKLAGLLGRSELPRREQREVLAAMYLQHGFLASAAQEWMAVCESSDADARAFLGLARVAVAQGQTEDAAVFAGEAARLDPANPAAHELLKIAGAAAVPALA
jgi:tetratricopeptide (TPR) repeat protein